MGRGEGEKDGGGGEGASSHEYSFLNSNFSVVESWHSNTVV